MYPDCLSQMLHEHYQLVILTSSMTQFKLIQNAGYLKNFEYMENVHIKQHTHTLNKETSQVKCI